jgi:hypothetical protein
LVPDGPPYYHYSEGATTYNKAAEYNKAVEYNQSSSKSSARYSADNSSNSYSNNKPTTSSGSFTPYTVTSSGTNSQVLLNLGPLNPLLFEADKFLRETDMTIGCNLMAQHTITATEVN